MKGALIFLLLLYWNSNFSQDTLIRSNLPPVLRNTKTLSAKQKQTRQILATSFQSGLITSSLLILNKYWYADFPKQPIASFNDSKEWLQIDKFGHVFSTYFEARASAAIWKWAGVDSRKSVVLGGLSAFAYQTSFEILDGYSAEYGFSWADMAANTFGAGIFMAQELIWNEQRIQPKISYSRQHYAPDLLPRIHQLYGKIGTERFLKDYNGQTHWLSFNLHAFAKKSTIPKWLNIAVGIGADGMLGGFENKWKDANNLPVTRYDIPRKRQFYLAPDLDFTKIKTTKKGVKILFHLLNLVKFPAPGVELTGGKLKVKMIAY